MCLKYEDEYSGCFDYLFIDDGSGNDIITLLGKYGATIKNWQTVHDEFYALLESWHERGIMKPKEVIG